MSVLILGASSSIGQAIATRFADAGFDVILHGATSGAALKAFQAGLQAKYPMQRFHMCLADLTDAIGQEAVVAAVRADLGTAKQGLDCIVFSQSTFEASTLESVSREQLRSSLALHVEAPLFILQGLLPLLRQAGTPSVVFMLDSFLQTPMPGRLAYITAKSATASLVKSLAGELGPQVRVNGIAPGIITWPDSFAEADKRRVLAKIPAGRTGRPDEIARAVFFAGVEATYMNGETLVIDGGRSAVP